MSFYNPNVISRLIVMGILFSLTGCVSSDRSDLEQQVSDILARPGTGVEKLPEIKPYEAYAYQSGKKNARSPFELFYQESPIEETEGEDAGLTEAMEKELRYRNREELEQFELDSLRMVGTMVDESNQWGIVRDPDGVVHRVRVGNYMGTNVGKILTIEEGRIELREIVKNSNGRWVERPAALALAEE